VTTGLVEGARPAQPPDPHFTRVSLEGRPMILPRVRIYKIAWNGNDGEVWYIDERGAVDHLRSLLGSCGFQYGTPVVYPGCHRAFRALPVVKRGCSLTELQEVCQKDPEVAIGRLTSTSLRT
jgi:hypothetical protein